jgi:hypothetical protein
MRVQTPWVSRISTPPSSHPIVRMRGTQAATTTERSVMKFQSDTWSALWTGTTCFFLNGAIDEMPQTRLMYTACFLVTQLNRLQRQTGWRMWIGKEEDVACKKVLFHHLPRGTQTSDENLSILGGLGLRTRTWNIVYTTWRHANVWTSTTLPVPHCSQIKCAAKPDKLL